MKKKLSVLLGIVLALSSLAACGNGAGSSSASSNSTAVSNPTTASSNPATDNKERKTLSIMTIDYNGNSLSAPGSDKVIEMVEEYTGYNLSLTIVPSGNAYKEKLGVTLMSKDMPMILTVNGAIDATMVQAANAGAFWDLSDYVYNSEKYPNLAQGNKDVAAQIITNGKLVGVYRARPVGRNGFGYRKDWADALGLSKPQSVADIYEMAKAFTTMDPDGNGLPDTYGFALYDSTDRLNIIQSWFGVGNMWATADDGSLIPNHYQPEYLESLNWLRQQYEEGLMPKDWAVRTKEIGYDAVKNGECGIFVTVLDDARMVSDYFEDSKIPAVTGDGYASLELVGALPKEAGGEPHILATSGMNGFFAVTNSAKTEDDLNDCLTFLDKMSDDEMLALAFLGIQDAPDGWSLDADGFAVINDTSIPVNSRAHNGLDQLTARVPNADPVSPAIRFTERQLAEAAVMEANVPYAVFNPAIRYLNNSQTHSMNGSNLTKILNDARVQYICLQLDEAGLRAAWDNWANQGGLKIIEEVNAQLGK